MSVKNPSADEMALDTLHAAFAQRAYDATAMIVAVKSGKLEPKGWTKLGQLVLDYAETLPQDAPAELAALATTILSEHAANGPLCGTKCGKNFGLVQLKIQQALIREAQDAQAALVAPAPAKPKSAKRTKPTEAVAPATPETPETPAAECTDTLEQPAA